MKGSAYWASTVLGIDEQGDVLCVVRAQRSRGRVQFTTLPAGDDELRRALERGTVCAAALSCRQGIARPLEAPLASVAKARKVLPALLDIQLPFPLEECVSVFLDCARTDQGTTRALAVAVRQTDARRKLDALAARGIDPMVLDHEGLALWTQSLREAPPAMDARDALRAVVYLGDDRAVLVVGRGREFRAAHQVTGHDAATFGRVLRPYAAATPGAQTVHWHWTGPGAAAPGVVDGLYAELAAQWPGPCVMHDTPATFLARAAAVRALETGPLRCNLRQGALAHEGLLRRDRRRSLRAVLVVLLAGLLLCAVNVGVRTVTARRKARIDTAFGALVDRLAGYHVKERGAHAVKTAQQAAARRREELKPFADAFEPSLAGVMGGLLERVAAAGVHVETLSLARDKLSASGVAPDIKAYNALAALFEAAGYPVVLTRQAAPADAGIPFTLASEGMHE